MEFLIEQNVPLILYRTYKRFVRPFGHSGTFCEGALSLEGYLPPFTDPRSSSNSENRSSSSSILYFGNSNHVRATGRNIQNIRMPKAIAVMTPTIVLIIGLAPPCARCRTCLGHTSPASGVRHRSGGS